MRKARILYPIVALFAIVLVIVLAARISAWRARVEYDRVVQEVAQWGLPTTLEELAERHTLPEDAVNGRELVLAAYEKIDWPGVNYDYMPIAGNHEIDPPPGEPYPASAMSEMRRFLERNAELIEEIHAAAREEHYRANPDFAAISTSLVVSVDDLSSIRGAARVLAIEALYAIENDRIADAIRTIDTGLRLAQKEMEQPDTMFFTAGESADGITLGQVGALLERGRLEESDFAMLTEVLDRHRANGDPAYAIWGGYLISDGWIRKMVDMPFLDVVSPAPGATVTTSDWREVLEYAAYTSLGLHHSDRLETARAIIQSLREHHDNPGDLFVAGIQGPNEDGSFGFLGSGRFLSNMVYTTSYWTRLSAVQRRVTFDSYRVLVAARWYFYREGVWPSGMDDLVPEYLDEAPNDPFGEGKLGYQHFPEHLAIYSVGPDGIDDGGFELWDLLGHGDDTTVWIRIPATSAAGKPE